MKKIIITILAVCLVVSLTTVYMFASPKTEITKEQTKTQTIEITDKNELAKYCEKNKVSPDNLKKVIVLSDVPIKNDVSYVKKTQERWGEWGYSIRVTDSDEVCGMDVIDSVSGTSELILECERSVSATWSTNCGVQASVVSVGLGYSVTDSYTVKRSTHYTPSPGHYGRIEAHPSFMLKRFDVMYQSILSSEPYKEGEGIAEIPNGVCFNIYEW
jgi:hypothetical protein